jgi:ABC-type nitrate/sulfonate/bicarbonate transport system permease component
VAADGAAFLAMRGDEEGTRPGVSCTAVKVDATGRNGVAWMRSVVVPPELPSRLANFRGRVEDGTIEALEGGMSAGWDCEVSAASASLKRLLAGVALTWIAGVRLGFLSPVNHLLVALSRKFLKGSQEAHS